ncbi:hypothetical protein ACI6QG_02765 [Roseococcus sp. DSY-14]|uniref:hypothetical protein n=1 Tax=Roseococcus sp. DSY-14 TaxID=3369650 RepID=UPI00387A9B2C
METGTVLRLAASVLLALGGLFLTRTHLELSSEQLGVLVFAGAVLWGYRTVAAHFDRQDRP